MAAFDGTRVQAPDTPDAAPLDVKPLSGLDFFQAAPRPMQDNRLGQLADALGGFDSSMKSFGRYYAMNNRVHDAGQNKAEEEQAQGLIASKTPEEWQAAVKAGQIPSFQSPVAQLAVDRTTGQYAAHQLGLDVQSKVATGELKWDDGSAQSYLQQQRQDSLKQWDPNSGQARGFGESFNTLWQNAGQKVAASQVQNTNDAHTNAAQQQIEMAVSGAFGAHQAPADAWKTLDNVRKGLVDTMHFEPKELDPMIFDALQRRMSTDPNWVMGVGNAPRTDLDGKTAIPSLFSKGSTMSQVAGMQQRAQQFNVNAAEQQQKDQVQQGVAQMLRTDPAALATVPEQIAYANPVSGSAGNVAKSGVIAAATTAIIDQDNKRIASGMATPEQVQDEQLRTFAVAGIKQHQWADQLNSVANGGGGPTGGGTPQALHAYQLYSSLRTKNPAYLDTLMDGSAKRFFNTAYMQQTLFGRDPASAMQASASIWGQPKTEEEGQAVAAQRKTIDDTAAGMAFGGWNFSGDGTWKLSDVKNPEIARNALTDAAWSLVKLNGMDPKTAIKTAAPIVQNAYVNVNGQLVPDLHYLPKDVMEPAVTDYLNGWAAGPAASLHLDPKNLSIQPQGTGRFLIVDATSGLPVSSSRGFSYVTPKDLISHAGRVANTAQTIQKLDYDTAAMKASQENHRLHRFMTDPNGVEPEQPDAVGLGIVPDPQR